MPQHPITGHRVPRYSVSLNVGNPMCKILCLFVFVAAVLAAADSAPLPLWPRTPPGEKGALGPEGDTTKPTDNLVAGRPVIRLGAVSVPTLTLYRAPQGRNTGATVVVFPGGGYSILAMDLEGTEVCEWLNSIGITAVLLKYRVPRRDTNLAYAAPLQDAQRAMGIVRHRAKDWDIDPARIGVVGFSAGGHLSAALCAHCATREYERVDASDGESCRPDFQMLIYPGGLNRTNAQEQIGAEVAVSTNTPPTFLVMAEDDPVRVENVLYYGLGLKQFRVPYELHVYSTGGHGYGLRRTREPVTGWPGVAADWMRSRKILSNHETH